VLAKLGAQRRVGPAQRVEGDAVGDRRPVFGGKPLVGSLDRCVALACEAGITTGTLSQLERGISNPSWGTLKAVAGALGVSMVELAKLTAKFEQ